MQNAKISKKSYVCDFCDKKFTDRSNKYRHQKYRCPKNANKHPIPEPKKIIKHKLGSTGAPSSNQANSENEQNGDKYEILSQKIENLAKVVEEKKEVNIGQQQVQNITTHHNTHNNTQYVTIYVTEKVDFVEILTNRFGGDRQKAIDYLKEKINNKVDGDVDLFCDIYLNGPKETWSCICQDKKNYVFQLRDANNNVINDPGGVQLYKNFRMNYINALLYLSSLELRRVIDFKVGTDEFAERRDYLMDEFDIGLVQDKMFGLSQQGNPEPFIKKVVKRIDMLEIAYSLSFHNGFFLKCFG